MMRRIFMAGLMAFSLSGGVLARDLPTDKSILFWSQDQRDAAFRTMETLPGITTRVIEAGKNAYPLPKGKPLSLCDDVDNTSSSEHCADPKNNAQVAAPMLIRWSIQEIRRIANRMAQRQSRPAHIIAWSLWRRAHQAVTKRTHVNHHRLMPLASCRGMEFRQKYAEFRFSGIG